ncbi:MAG TPA: rod shape-determining protein RodA [Chromatiales bacterium]|nr:rod shape-determining protein RodA [Chromatiales bacterium]
MPGAEAARRAPGLAARLHLDLPLLLGLLAVAGIGLVVLYSASGERIDVVWRQLLRLAIGFGVMVAAAQIPPQTLRRWAPWLYAAGTLLLVAVLAVGATGKGAQRWLDLGVVRFQPSELMKLALPMVVAWHLADAPLPPDARRVLATFAAILVPVALIARQPDLGTALVVGAAGFFALFLAGLRWRWLAGLALVAAAGAPALWHVMHDYQRARVLTFLNPERDPLGAGYHIIQSKIAIGSGGLFGKGWLHGTQAHLEFLPERATDFIFAVLGEEFGLTGTLALLALYLFLVLRGLHIAARAQDTFGRLVAGALSLTFLVYVVVNTGMVTGLLPVVGLPLPLVSYGGTSLVTVMAGFGILMSVHTHRKLLSPS